MKESSTEPPKKKLKQARLPFQILSPPVVKNVESLPSQCKRKACETASSDDDVVISEINENKIKPVEKKAKVASKDKDQEKKQSSDVCMEVEETEEGGKKVSATKQKSKKTVNSSKKVIRTTSNRKTKGKSSSKVLENENETKINISKSKPEVVDFVDLSDSPVKTSGKDKESTSTSIPKCDISTSVSDVEGTQLNDNEDDESKTSVSCTVPDKDVPNLEVCTGNEKDSGQQERDSKMHCNVSSNESKNVKDDDSTEKKNSDLECPVKGKVTKEASCSNNAKDSTHKSKSSCSNKKSPTVKSSLKQPSIKVLVTSKSPKTNSSSNSSTENREFKNCKSDTTTEECSPTNVSNTCSTTSRHGSPPKSVVESVVDESNLKTPSTSDSPTIDSSPSSECNTSSLSTPSTDPVKTISKTPRRMTPKQLLKLKDKEEKMKEKERLKEELEKKKTEEKEKKLKLKQEKEEERLRLKQEKEDEKRKEKEEKEKKKQAELDKKSEEKRLKEEEKRQKEEEKQAKEEEKKKKEEEERKKKEEKRLREEQKQAEKRKSAQAFASFFVKTEAKAVGVEEDKENTPDESNFQPFEVKNDMRLAPLLRTQLPEERRQLLDSALVGSEAAAGQRLYLEQIRSPSYVCGSATRTWPPPDETDDEVIIIESEQPNEEMEIDEDETEKKPEKRHRRAKLLQFHENRRPPYWGTWRKKSRCIRPRAPLNQDKTMLEYEVDSDDEWEEPEDGESLRGSEDEESQDEQYEEDDDMFVPHGYLSDGEGEDELDDQSPETMKARLKLLQLEFEAERNEKQQKLKPRFIGCVWFCNSETSATNEGSQIPELFLLRTAVWEGPLPVTVAPPLPSSPSTAVAGSAANTPGDEPKSGAKKKLVKESLVPDIIKKMHGSRKKLSKLLLELLEEWDKDKAEALPSKNCLAKKVRELAVWERPAGAVHHCWYVKDDVRRAYGLTDLDLPPPSAPSPSCPSPVSNITKFTKVLTTDERLKLLRELPAANKEVPSKTPLTPSQNLKTPIKSVKTPIKSVKTPTVKLGTPSPAVKKRASLITVGPKESPKQNSTTSIMNFVTKSAKSETSETTGKQETVKVEEKAKKRITPITLTTAASKPAPPPPSSEGDCIIIDD